MHKIAVYGSLKKGLYNHTRFGLGEPVGHGKVVGAMFLCYSYPHLYRQGVCDEGFEREHDVEVFEVDDDTFNAIRAMELGAGYQEVEREIDGHEVVVFFSDDELDYKDNWIESYDHNSFALV